MKKLILISLFFPLSLFAQTDLSQENMMQMMEQAQKAQACMEGIDMSAIEGLEAEGEHKQAEVKALCVDGKRDEAQEVALNYAKEMMARPEMQALKKCSEPLRGLIPDMPFDDFEEKYESTHVCDEI